jgi:glutathione peroxidase
MATIASPSVYDFSATALDGKPVSLSTYQGQVLLIVNTASACGFTPQYKGLQALYDRYKTQGLTVLGFPCNQFGQQEPGTADQIRSFCDTNFGVTFPLFQKIEVNGNNAHPLYQFLTKSAPGIFGTEAIKWNFTKFLIDRSGQTFKRYPSTAKPEDLIKDIEQLLAP